MGRTSYFSKEVKIKACEEYIKGNKTYRDIGKVIGTTRETVRQWHLAYQIHGPDAFVTSDHNRPYSKRFKMSVIEEYISTKYSATDLAAKYNISSSVISSWINKWYTGMEIEDYNPKEDIYTMKSRKTTYKERLEIAQWVIENDMNYKEAALKYAINYALVYRWTQIYITEGPDKLEYRKRGPKSKLMVDENSLSELEKLKIELEREKTIRKRRELELEVLKKKAEFEQHLQSQE